MNLAKFAVLSAPAMLLFSAAPALAQSQGEVGTAAFERGRASGVTPQTLGEETTCAIYWNAWYNGIEDFVLSDDLLAALPEETDSAAAYDTAAAWATLVMAAHIAEYGNHDRLEAAFERQAAGIEAKVDKVAAGDTAETGAVLETLGSCRFPGS